MTYEAESCALIFVSASKVHKILKAYVPVAAVLLDLIESVNNCEFV
jgi:hypothetical protein